VKPNIEADETEIITRYERGKPDQYSTDGGKTFRKKLGSDIEAEVDKMDEQL
jgi:hypothetical protein